MSETIEQPDSTFVVRWGTQSVVVSFTDLTTGLLVDPALYSFTLAAPDRSQTTPSATRISLGKYQLVLDFKTAGTWYLRARSEAPGAMRTKTYRFIVQHDALEAAA